MKVEVPGRRSTIMDSPDGFEIIIPGKRNFFIVAFLGFWTIGWACGEVFAIRQLFFANKGPNFPYISLCLAWCMDRRGSRCNLYVALDGKWKGTDKSQKDNAVDETGCIGFRSHPRI